MYVYTHAQWNTSHIPTLQHRSISQVPGHKTLTALHSLCQRSHEIQWSETTDLSQFPLTWGRGIHRLEQGHGC